MIKEEKEIKQPTELKPSGPPKSTAREYFESFVVTLVMAIFGMTFILQAVTVPTGSMQNTILVGD
ncbi:MAG: S26 family signal peptidase, partial [Pyrinomonadaceae bacterium]|nr:S26 family signal peptidase [Pyrinomonadaceae bacterium]